MINKMDEPSRMLPVDTTVVAPAASVSVDSSLTADKSKMETPSQSSGASVH